MPDSKQRISIRIVIGILIQYFVDDNPLRWYNLFPTPLFMVV